MSAEAPEHDDEVMMTDVDAEAEAAAAPRAGAFPYSMPFRRGMSSQLVKRVMRIWNARISVRDGRTNSVLLFDDVTLRRASDRWLETYLHPNDGVGHRVRLGGLGGVGPAVGAQMFFEMRPIDQALFEWVQPRQRELLVPWAARFKERMATATFREQQHRLLDRHVTGSTMMSKALEAYATHADALQGPMGDGAADFVRDVFGGGENALALELPIGAVLFEGRGMEHSNAR